MSNRFQKLKTFKMPKEFRGRSPLFVQLWWCVQKTFFALSPQVAYRWRNFLLRCFGAKIGVGVIIRPTVRVTYPWKLSVGDYSWIGDDVVLYSLGEISIGSNVVVSQNCYLCTGSHDYLKLDFPIWSEKIQLEDECWLASGVYVAPNVLIGKGAVIAARSTVLKNVEPGWIYAGYPAKKLKKRVESDSQHL